MNTVRVSLHPPRFGKPSSSRRINKRYVGVVRESFNQFVGNTDPYT